MPGKAGKAPESQAQRRFMYAAARDPATAKRLGVPTSVAKEFVAGDKPGKLPERKTAERKPRAERWYGAKA